MRRDGKWGQRLMKDRSALAEVMDGFMERAPKELSGALPTVKNISGGPKSPDFSRPVDAEKIDRALRYSRLVMGCKPFAVAGSFGASVKKAEEDMCQILRSYNEDVVKELRTTDDKRRAVAESQFELCAKLTAILFSEEEAELLRRRGRAALGAAAGGQASAFFLPGCRRTLSSRICLAMKREDAPRSDRFISGRARMDCDMASSSRAMRSYSSSVSGLVPVGIDKLHSFGLRMRIFQIAPSCLSAAISMAE